MKTRQNPRRSQNGRQPRHRPLITTAVCHEEIEDLSEFALPRIGSLARTRRLLLAALRVWELKRGIRN